MTRGGALTAVLLFVGSVVSWGLFLVWAGAL